ncbi:MAG: hypothetical protein HZA88_05565 [Verrucomicrobia bacterium]|nr:hypothetical protein [Verrucomicrobiota bacterium]
MSAKDTSHRNIGGTPAGTRLIVKVRWLKPYEGAQNHICIGEVLAETPQCLKVLGRTYHFRRPQGNIRAVQTSAIKVRWIPWNRIEMVTELHPDTDWRNLQLKVDDNNRVSVTGSVAHGELVAD